MGETYNFTPDYATHPGETVREKLEELGMSQKEFAIRTGRPQKTISDIINAKSAIVPETAVQFEKVLGIPANYWLSHQAIFDEFKARKKRKDILVSARNWTKLFPYAYLESEGLVKSSSKIDEKTEELLSFFNVSSHKSWEDIYINADLPLLFRQSLKNEKDPYALSVLLRIAEIEARKMETPPFDEKLFKELLPTIREVMNNKSDHQLEEIKKLCSQAGVKLVFSSYLKRSNIFGVVRWIDNWPVVLMTDRNKRYDIFWFSLFHEFGHVLLHKDKKQLFLDGVENNKNVEAEIQANLFANEWLLNDSDYQRVVTEIDTSESLKQISHKISAIAKKLELPADIILGRILRDKPELYKLGLAKSIAEVRF